MYPYKFKITKLKDKSFEINFIVDLENAVAEFTNNIVAEAELDKMTDTQRNLFCSLMCELVMLKANQPTLNS